MSGKRKRGNMDYAKLARQGTATHSESEEEVQSLESTDDICNTIHSDLEAEATGSLLFMSLS